MPSPQQQGDATPEATSPASPNASNDVGSFIPRALRTRTMSILQSDIPRGMSGLTGVAAAQAPSLSEVRQGAYTTEGEERMQQFAINDTPADFHERRRSAIGRARKESNAAEPPQPLLTTDPAKNAIEEEVTRTDNATPPGGDENLVSIERIPTAEANDATGENIDRPALVSHPTVYDLQRSSTGTFPNGYRFPPKHTWKEATSIGFKGFLNFTFRSWIGFLIVFYAVQVVGWGGMIFLLLCGAGDPRMCWLQRPPGSGNWVKDCSSKHTSKSLWIEIDAQVLTGLFCVTAFGLAPWRCRDLWHLMQYRIWHEHLALRKLAAAHKGWFRLPESQHLDPLVQAKDLNEVDHAEAVKVLPYPLAKSSRSPLTGVRALPTKLWKMDFVVWMMFLNTIFQVILCGFMWGQNRYKRASVAVALPLVLGMLSGIAAGWIQFAESKKIKQREGIRWKATDKGFDVNWAAKREKSAQETA